MIILLLEHAKSFDLAFRARDPAVRIVDVTRVSLQRVTFADRQTNRRTDDWHQRLSVVNCDGTRTLYIIVEHVMGVLASYSLESRNAANACIKS